MTREEEIKKEALFNCNDVAGEVDYKSTAAYEGFIKGAEWADETMIDKACKWLKENISNYVGVYVSDYYIYDDELVEDFKKGMKGE